MRTNQDSPRGAPIDAGSVRRSRISLSLVFGALAAMILSSQLFAYFSSRGVQANVDLIAENALVSVRLAEHMGKDIERRRSLIERHIFEREAAKEAGIEKELAAVRDDYEAAAQGYAPLASFPGEAAAWRQLSDDAARLEGPANAVLDLSRDGKDEEARRALARLEPSFTAAEHDVDALVQINEAAGDRALAGVREAQRAVMRTRWVLSLLAAGITIAVGFWASKRLTEEMQSRVRSTEQLQHANRLATVGQLAAGLAHELGSPLQVVSGRAKMVATGEVLDGDAREAGKVILGQAVRMTQIIRGLLDFARRRPPQASVADLRDIARDTLRIIEPLTKKKGVALNLEVAGPVSVRADVVQIQQALTNLVMNAIQAVGEQGRVTILVRTQPATPPSDRDGPRSEYACLGVKDDGPGIKQADLPRVFEPFFTTKDVGEGTGLGLAIAHGLVAENGGWIAVESEVGQGACFSIFLPCHAKDAGPA